MLGATLTIMRPELEWQQGEEKRNQLDITAIAHLRDSDIQRWITGIWNVESKTAELSDWLQVSEVGEAEEELKMTEKNITGGGASLGGRTDSSYDPAEPTQLYSTCSES